MFSQDQIVITIDWQTRVWYLFADWTDTEPWRTTSMFPQRHNVSDLYVFSIEFLTFCQAEVWQSSTSSTWTRWGPQWTVWWTYQPPAYREHSENHRHLTSKIEKNTHDHISQRGMRENAEGVHPWWRSGAELGGGWWVAEFAKSAARDQQEHSKSAGIDPVDPDQHAEMWRTTDKAAVSITGKTWNLLLLHVFLPEVALMECILFARREAASSLPPRPRSDTHPLRLSHAHRHTRLPAADCYSCNTPHWRTATQGSHDLPFWGELLTRTHAHMHTLTHWTACRLCVLRTLSGDKRSSLWLWLGSSGSFVCT